MPFATKTALNATAKHVVERENQEIRSLFDRPNPRTQNAVKIFKGATKTNLAVLVGIDDGVRKTDSPSLHKGTLGKSAIPPSKYLLAQVTGGSRVPKRFERALQLAGVMPSGMFAIFAKRSNALDQYGNITQGKIVQILAWFKAFPETGYKANMTDKTKENLRRGKRKGMKWGVAYFRGGRGTGLPDGIWERHYPNGTAGKSFVRPVLIYVRSVSYQSRFDFEGIARSTVDKVWRDEFDKALAQAIATARS